MSGPGVVQVRRDPFARETLVRRVVAEPYPRRGCAWCGSSRARGRLFQYGVAPDALGNRTSWDRHYFCALSCRSAFYG